MVRRDEPIVGLDIGTTKVCAIVAERSESGDEIDIVGIGPGGHRQAGQEQHHDHADHHAHRDNLSTLAYPRVP